MLPGALQHMKVYLCAHPGNHLQEALIGESIILLWRFSYLIPYGATNVQWENSNAARPYNEENN